MTTQKRALVTGATAGLGFEFAIGLAKRGYHVVIASRNLDKMQWLKQKLSETYSVEVSVIKVDLCKPNGAEDLFEQCKQLNIHILINNAGYGAYGHHVEQSADGIAEMIQLDVTAVAQLSALFGRIMKSDGNGYIMNSPLTGSTEAVFLGERMTDEKSPIEKKSTALIAELSPEVFAIWRKPSGEINPVAIIATIDTDGNPRTAPFGSLTAVTPCLLRFCCRHGNNTYTNLCRHGRVSIALVSPNCAVSVRGQARLIKLRMVNNPEFAIFEIDIEEVKNDMIARLTIESGIGVCASEQHEQWFNALLSERDAS